MKKIILSSALCLNLAQAKVDYLIGLHFGGEQLSGKIKETVSMPTKYYEVTQKNKGRGIVGGINLGAQIVVSKFLIGTDLELSFSTSKQTQTQTFPEPTLDFVKLYQRTLRHTSSQNIGLKLGYAIQKDTYVYARPMVGMDRFEVKTMYLDDITRPRYQNRKNSHVRSTGIGLGLEKRAGNILFGIEGRYIKSRSFKQTNKFLTPQQDTLTLKYQPTRYVGMIKISYIF